MLGYLEGIGWPEVVGALGMAVTALVGVGVYTGKITKESGQKVLDALAALTKRAPVLLLAVVLSGCAFSSNEAIGVFRAAAIAQVEALNAAGVDPLKLDPKSLVIATSSCNTIAAVVTMTDPGIPEASPSALDYCADLAKVLAPADFSSN